MGYDFDLMLDARVAHYFAGFASTGVPPYAEASLEFSMGFLYEFEVSIVIQR